MADFVKPALPVPPQITSIHAELDVKELTKKMRALEEKVSLLIRELERYALASGDAAGQPI